MTFYVTKAAGWLKLVSMMLLEPEDRESSLGAPVH
jgi:hypothetical protein